MLEFIELRIKNFLSFGNIEQSIKLNEKPFHLITGLNMDKSNTEDNKNGSGKSSILNALTYALYGRAVGNKINVSNLVNYINKKNLYVYLHFKKDDVDYEIERGRNPTYLKLTKNHNEVITDESLGDSRDTQDVIQSIIGMEEEVFYQIIALNTSVPVFMNQTTSNQKSIIEHILGVDILSKKIDVLKSLIKKSKQDIINEKFRLDTIKSNNDKLKASLENQKANILSLQSKWNNDHNFKLSVLQNEYNKYCHIDILEEEKLQNELKRWNESNELKAFKLKQITDNNNKIEKLESKKSSNVLLISQLQSVDFESEKKIYDEIEEIKKQEQEYNIKRMEQKNNRASINVIQDKMRFNNSKLAEYKKELDELRENKCPTCGQVINSDKIAELRETLTNNINKLASDNQDLLNEGYRLEELCKKFIDKVFTYPTPKYKTLSMLLSEENKLKSLEVENENIDKQITEIKALNEEIKVEEISEKPVTKLSSYEEFLKAKMVLNDYGTKSAQLMAEINPFDEQLQNVEKSLSEIVYPSEDNYSLLLDEQHHQEVLLKLLNSPNSFVRKSILDKAIDYLNVKIKKYLMKLHSLHSAKFNNDMSMEISYMGQEFGYVSSGEEGRIVLALNFAFLDVWESLNGCPINLMFIDEVIDRLGLDKAGVKDLWNLLHDMDRKNIFLVSHNETLIANPENIIKVIKEKGFSHLEYINND